jgi:hypothetical protein
MKKEEISIPLTKPMEEGNRESYLHWIAVDEIEVKESTEKPPKREVELSF